MLREIALTEVASELVAAIATAQQYSPLPLPIEDSREALQQALRGLNWRLRLKCEPAVPIPPKPVALKELPPPLVALEVETDASAWDPSPDHSPFYDEIETSRCRALLLEIIRRAAHDWVLYRFSTRLQQQELAKDAYIWLFEEEAGHPNWIERQKNGLPLTAFIAICEELDLDPESVRDRVRKMDVRSVMSAGRPAERRRKQTSEDVYFVDHAASGVDVHSVRDGREYSNSYEEHYATHTLDSY